MPDTDPVVQSPEHAIGLRVRGQRKRLRLRLRELAAQAECSESLLSRLENGLVMPSLSTLHRIAKALGVNVGALLEPQQDATLTIYRPEQRPPTSMPGAAEGDGSSAQSLVPFAEHRLLEALIVSLPAGGAPCGPFVHDGEEVGLVLEGALELIVMGVSHLVVAHSSFFLQSNRPHSYRAHGQTECRVMWVNTPPTF